MGVLTQLLMRAAADALQAYPHVAAALLPAIRDVLGQDVATDEVLAAWGEAYWIPADILIAAGSQAYEDATVA